LRRIGQTLNARMVREELLQLLRQIRVRRDQLIGAGWGAVGACFEIFRDRAFKPVLTLICVRTIRWIHTYTHNECWQTVANNY
jgi:hypothetical protein